VPRASSVRVPIVTPPVGKSSTNATITSDQRTR
jgi:hypothetical protein